MQKIFVSYRRQDTRDVTGRMCDRLLRHFAEDEIFKDVDDIPPGADYRALIDRQITHSAVVLAMIGPQWLSATGRTGQRRLDEPDDMVRQEVEIALHKQVEIVPVLVNDALMPEAADLPESIRPLAYRNAIRLRPDPDFHRDMDRLVAQIEEARDRAAAISAQLPAPSDAETAAAHEALKRQLELERVKGLIHAPVSLLFWACGLGLLGSLAFVGVPLFAATDPEGGDVPVEVRIICFIIGLALMAVYSAGVVAATCMHRRRNYWLAVAGVGVVGAASVLCCPYLGLPAAIWAVMVLIRPEVKAAFNLPASISPS